MYDAETLRRSMARLDGLVKAVSDGYLREQLAAEISALTTSLDGLVFSHRMLDDQNRCLSYPSRRDEVTELPNQRHFMERLDEEFRRALRYKTPLSLLIADVDDFAVLVDTRGHLVGNQLLRRLARAVRQNTRDADIAARHGAAEVALLLPHTDPAGAARLAERLRTAVAQLPDRVSVTIGIASLDLERPAGVLELLTEADAAMLRAKTQRKTHATRGASWIPGNSFGA
jgi:diguanylate cyclase (GGDEF)-like protein